MKFIVHKKNGSLKNRLILTTNNNFYYIIHKIKGICLVLQLLRQKADVNFTNEHGNTPLHYACFWNYQSIAEDLVAQGALVSIANKDGDTPLDKAKGPLSKQLHGKFYH